MLKISTKLSTFSYSHWKWKVNHCSVAYTFSHHLGMSSNQKICKIV